MRNLTCFNWLRIALISCVSRSYFALSLLPSPFFTSLFPALPAFCVMGSSPSIRALIGLSFLVARFDWLPGWLPPLWVTLEEAVVEEGRVGGARRGGDLDGECFRFLFSSSEKLSGVS